MRYANGVPPGWVLFKATTPSNSDNRAGWDRWWHVESAHAYFEGPSLQNDISMLDWHELVGDSLFIRYKSYPTIVALPIGA